MLLFINVFHFSFLLQAAFTLTDFAIRNTRLALTVSTSENIRYSHISTITHMYEYFRWVMGNFFIY